MRKIGQQVRLGNNGGGAPNPARPVENEFPQLGKDTLLNFNRSVMRRQDLSLILLEFRSRKPLRIYQCLLSFVIRGSQRLIGLRYLDVIAEDRVVADLQRTNSRSFAFAFLD